MRTRTQWLPATLAGVAMWLSATSAHTSAAPAPAEQQAAPPQAAAVSSSEQTPAAPTPPDAPTPPEAQGAPPQATARERLSLNLQNVETRAALQLIADFADVNLVVADGVSGTVALRLRDISWDEALDVILASNGLGKRQRGNVLLVAPAEALASHEKMALESGRALAELAPLATEFIRIRYADAATLAALFDAETGAFARSERGRVLVDARTNALVVSETAANLAAIRGAIAQLDVPVRQVRIEARVVSANNNFSEQLGVRWGGGGHRGVGQRGKHLKWGGSLRTLSELQNTIADDEVSQAAISHPGALVADLAVTDQGTTSIGFGLTGPGFLLDLELSALRRPAKPRSSPARASSPQTNAPR